MGLVFLEEWSALWCHPGGPLHPTKSWWPLGTAQLLVRVSGHPAWPGLGRPILSASSWLFSVSLAVSQAGHGAGQRRD